MTRISFAARVLVLVFKVLFALLLLQRGTFFLYQGF